MKSMMECAAAVVLMLAAFTGTGIAADDKIEAAEKAGALAAALTEAESFYLEGLKNADTGEALKKIQPEMKKVRDHAAWLRRRVQIKGNEGFVEDLVWRWRSASDMSNALENDIRKASPGFRLDLEAETAGDSALFAKRCISMYLQLPREEYLQKISKSSRKFGCFSDNLAILKNASSGRSLISISEQWSTRVTGNLFYFWMMHRGVDRVQTWPADLSDPLAFALRQAEDVMTMASCAFAVPHGSLVAREYSRKLKVIADVTVLMQSYLYRFRSGRTRQILRMLSGVEKLDLIWTRWGGKTGYLFYVPAMSDKELTAQVGDILAAQIPISEKYAQDLKKARKINEKLARDAKFERKKKTDDKEKDPAEADGEDKKRRKVEVAAPPVPKEPFSKAIYEYNLEIFAGNGCLRKDAQELEQFRRDMVIFYGNVVKFRAAVAAFRAAFPNCSLGKRSGPSGESGKSHSFPRERQSHHR